jgi:hypothetical protein
MKNIIFSTFPFKKIVRFADKLLLTDEVKESGCNGKMRKASSRLNSIISWSLFMKKGFFNHLLLTAAAFCILTVVFAGCGSSGGSSNGPAGSNLSNAVITLAGLPPYVNGTGSAANFNSPSGVATDGTNLT